MTRVRWGACLAVIATLAAVTACSTPEPPLLHPAGTGTARYVALGDYIAHQIVRTSMVVTVVFLVYHLLDAMVQASFDPQSHFGTFLRRITGLGERAIERLRLIFRTTVDLILVIGGIPLLLLLWTLNWVDLRGLVNSVRSAQRISS